MLRRLVDTTNSPRDPSELQKPLKHFRAKTKRLKIHPLELATLWVVGAHLVFLPWALGGMRIWAQVISLALSAIGFALALLPRNYTEEHTRSDRFRILTRPKLLKFPIFWLGLALLGYLTVGALNPAWVYRTDGKGWWMDVIAHKTWLPVSVDVPFERWGPWRMLTIYISAWLTVCSVWVGFTRRRSVQLLIVTLAFNGLLLAGLGIAQRLLGNGKMFWFLEVSSGASFFSTFVYKNHAGEYLLLGLANTCGLAGWHYLRGLRRLEKSNPSGVLAFFSTCIAVAIVTSYARGATLVMLAFLLVCVIAFVVHQLTISNENRKPIVAIVLILIFGYFLKTGLDAIRVGRAWDRMEQGLTRKDDSLESRELATKASMEMLGDHWLAGVGAGGFRFTFTTYQHCYPSLTKTPSGRAMFWEHAHNDLVQFPIELGAIGVGFVVIGFGYWFMALVRSYFWENPLSSCIVFGALLLLLYSRWDFPFQCPAILITWCALWPIATMWSRFEEAGVKA